MSLHRNRTGWTSWAFAAVVLAPLTGWADEEVKKVPERSEIQPEYLWATETIFPNTDAWETELTELQKRIEQFEKLKGTLAKGPAELLAALDFRDQTEARLDRLMVYASLLSDQDTRDNARQAMDSRATSLAVKYSQATAWIEPELTAIPWDTLESRMKESAKLAVYRQHLDNLFRQKKHILGPREEELIAMAGEVRRTPYNAYNLLTNADAKFPIIKDEKGTAVEMTDSAFYLYMRSPDRRVRKDAYEGIVGTYKGFRNTSAALLNGAVQSHIFTVKARGYESCLAASLDQGNIPVQVYETLVKTVNDNLPLLHRYAELRKRALKLDDGTHDYDLYTPFIAGQSMDLTYEKSIVTIATALNPLGSDYLDPMQKGFASRWVDVFPTKGKRSGAYSSGTFLTQPFILMNYYGGYEDMSTLAHEMGHSMHSFFSRNHQPYVYSNYDIFCAEVASTCNEILLQKYVLGHTEDPKKKLYLLSEFLEGIRGTIFRQTMFSEFEQTIHAMAEDGKALTADAISAAYGEIMKRYYGPSYVHDELVDNYWIRIPHFYYNFYVYKYATSYCAASNIAGRILNGEPGAVDAYVTFLKGGCSKYPIDLLKTARVDMLSPQPIQDGMGIFKDLLDQAEALLKQLKMI